MKFDGQYKQRRNFQIPGRGQQFHHHYRIPIVSYKIRIIHKHVCRCQQNQNSEDQNISKSQKRGSKKFKDGLRLEDFRDYNEDEPDTKSLGNPKGQQGGSNARKNQTVDVYKRRAEIKTIHRRLEQAYSASKLAEVVKQDLGIMDRWNTCTAIYRLARMFRLIQQKQSPEDVIQWRRAVAGPLVKEMEWRILQLIPQYNCIDISLTVWSLGVLNIYHPSLLPALVQQAKGVVQTFKPQDCSTMLWGLAKLEYQDTSLLLNLCLVAERRITQFKPQELSNFIWANAKLGFFPGDNIIIQTLNRLRRMDLNDADPQELINILWALALFKQSTENIRQSVITIVVTNLMQRTNDFTPQDFSNLAWALVRLKYGEAIKTVSSLSKKAIPCLDQFKPQEISNLLYAQVKCFLRLKYFLPALEISILKNKLMDYKDQEICILLWAFGRMRYLPSQQFLNLLNNELINRLPYMLPKSYVLIVKSYARLAYDPGLLLYRLAREVEQKLDLFDVSDVSNLIYAFAKLHRRDERLVDAVSQTTERRLSRFSDDELRSILQSCTSLGYNPMTLQYLIEIRKGTVAQY